jgi:acyl carrier protein
MQTARAEDVQVELKQILLSEFFEPGDDPRRLGADTPLVTGSVLHHIAVLKLVGILEQRFGIEFTARDLDPMDFDTFGQIADAVVRKCASRTAPAPQVAPEASAVPWWQIGRLAQLFG